MSKLSNKIIESIQDLYDRGLDADDIVAYLDLDIKYTEQVKNVIKKWINKNE